MLHRNKKKNTDGHFENVQVSEDGQIVECPECGQKVSKRGYVTHHKLTHGSLPPGYSESRKSICEHCSAEFVGKKRLAAHIKREHSEAGKLELKTLKEYKCDSCSLTFKNTVGYFAHFRQGQYRFGFAIYRFLKTKIAKNGQ